MSERDLPAGCTGYIAVDHDGIAIWGIGDTPEAALVDVREWTDDRAYELPVYAATPALIAAVREHGGCPDWVIYGYNSGDIVSPQVAAQAPEHYIACLASEYSYECAYCGAELAACEAPPDGTPDPRDERAWAALAEEHAPGCEWVATRGHRRTVTEEPRS